MRTLIATAFMSVDGVVEAPGAEPGHHSNGWTSNAVDHDDAADEIKAREQEEAGAMTVGRLLRGVRAGVARPRLLPALRRDAHVRRVVDAHRGRDRAPAARDHPAHPRRRRGAGGDRGGPISVHGSATLVRGLTDAGLVDRFHLLVFPLVLGAGKRYSSETEPAAALRRGERDLC